MVSGFEKHASGAGGKSTGESLAQAHTRHPLLKRLWCQNPFYIISAGCTVHGIGLWFKGGQNSNPWALMAVIGSYILMMALAAFAVVRLGKVWDDARSIFVIILLLFVELTLSFDGTFLRDPMSGRALLVFGLGLAAFVTECLLFSLNIRLKARYRVPYYLMLGQLFLYPLFLRPVLNSGNITALNWRLFLFSPIAAISIVSLIPAIRGGANYIRENGTPWIWPLYPWTIFFTLIVCLSVRAFAICAAFDPVLSQTLQESMQLQSGFNGYYLAPIVIAVSLLLLEGGLQSGRKKVSFLALTCAATAIALSAIPAGTAPQKLFLAEYTQKFGSPVYVALCAATLFYAFALIRKAPLAEFALHLAVGSHYLIGPGTFDMNSPLPNPGIWPLATLTLWHIAAGCWRWQPRRLVVGLLIATACAHLTLFADLPTVWRMVLTAQIGWGIVAIGSILFQDGLLRKVAIWALGTFGPIAILWAPVAGLDVWIPLTYAISIALLSLLCARFLKDRLCVAAATTNGAFALLESGHLLLRWLREQPNWQGIAYYLAGMAWLALGLIMSAWKAYRIRSQPE